MAKAINFVGERRKKLTQAQKQDQKILKIAINALIGVFAVFLIVVGVRFYFVFRVKDIKDTEAQIRTRILANEPVEKDYIIFAQKLKKLALFFGRRKDKQEALVFFSEVFGPDVIVSGIDYSSDEEDVVSFTIKAPNVFVMERVFATLQEEQVTSVYPNIRKSSMRRSATGNYTVDLAVVLAAENPSPAPTTSAVPAQPATEEE
ncbi:MAG: hypothetical protein BroJett025_01770 [Patescibacteria group bacterium]|nr:MAG: hypothetical protein BroJett025_01770 [Patescibacteria group bacterium]